jgi:hypothetical protein
MLDLKWLESTPWLHGEQSTVKIPQSVLKELYEEVKERRGEWQEVKDTPTARDMERRLLALHILAQEEGKENPDLKWATGYALRLLAACQEVLWHLKRLSSPHFVSRGKLEAAMRGER